MADAITKFEKAKVDFIYQTGKEPESFYLGESELKELLTWMEENQYMRKEETEQVQQGNSGFKLLGLSVYVVKERSHIKCA